MTDNYNFNFDIDQMKRSIDSGSITVPKGMDREQMRVWIECQVNICKKCGQSWDLHDFGVAEPYCP